MPRTLTANEYKAELQNYKDAYAAGLTWQTCTICEKPCIEQSANWDFWTGRGTILHHGNCTRLYKQIYIARDWFELFLDTFLTPTPKESSFYDDLGDADEYMELFIKCLGIEV